MSTDHEEARPEVVDSLALTFKQIEGMKIGPIAEAFLVWCRADKLEAEMRKIADANRKPSTGGAA